MDRISTQISTLLILPVAAAALATARPPYERYLEQYQRSQVFCREDTRHALVISKPAVTEIFFANAPMVQDKQTHLREKIRQFAALPDGWDGQGSVKPSAAAVHAASAFLDGLPSGIAIPTPMVTRRGEMEFYWQLRAGYADVSFDADGIGSFFARNPAGDELFLDNLGSDFRQYPNQELILGVLAPHLLAVAA